MIFKVSKFNPTPRYIKFSAIDCISEGFELIKSDFWLFLAMMFVGSFVGGLFPLILMGPIFLGFFYCLKAKEQNQPVKFEMVFKGFEKFLDGLLAFLLSFLGVLIIILPLIILLIVLLATSVLTMTKVDTPLLEILGGSSVILILLAVAIGATGILNALFIFSYPLIVDQNFTAWNAVKMSVAASLKNIWTLFLLSLIHLVLSFIGLCFCYVGILFVLPITYASWQIAYKRIFYES